MDVDTAYAVSEGGGTVTDVLLWGCRSAADGARVEGALAIPP